MKIIFTTLLLVLFFINSFSQTNNNEFRSIWIVTWEYISGGSTVEQNKQRINSILDNMNKANMTSVLWQVRQAGTAYYHSAYEPWGSYAGSTYPGFDPLQYAIDEAHKRGLELHAWFNVFASGSTAPGTPAKEHPEWICRDQAGSPMTASIALSPGLPEVRAYLQNVAMDLVRNYDIDGLHLDYVRWNEYSSTNNGRYLYDVQHPYSAGVPSGFDSWPEWWRWSTTEFVKGLQDSLKSEKPWVKLSIAAIGAYNWGGWNGYSSVYQDAALWFNEGYIDQIAGMHYSLYTGNEFINMLLYSCPQCWSQYIQPGVAAGRLYTVGPGSYQLYDRNLWGNHPDIVNKSRIPEWVDGFQFFSYRSWNDKEYFEEAGKTLFPSKTKVRNALASNELVAVPSVQISKVNDKHYQLRVTPPALDKPYWFAVYRSETDNFSRDTTDIVHVMFSDTAFTVNEIFDGLQDYNGSYRYSVTMLNRYWKESGLSNMVGTDPIPSDPPTVALTIPAEGDTAAITTPVEVRFSKNINQTGLQNYLSFDPPVTITSVLASPQKVIINTSGFQYSTTYTLKVDSELRDVNGRMLDGNKDGIEGDPFFLTFETIGADSVGPELISFSLPAEDSLDVEDVIRIIFNEPLDTHSVNTLNFVLMLNSVTVPSEPVLRNYGSGAVVSVKPPYFAQSSEYTLLVKKETADLSGNQMASDHSFTFRTRAEGYSIRRAMDNFTQTAGWEQPNYSGSTVGTLLSGTYFSYSVLNYLPSTTPQKSAELGYKWNPDVPVRLLREYLSGGTPRTIEFDTTVTLQVYLHGDGSGTLFRFALDENNEANTWPGHEVSQWIPIDWHGWKLVEWKLGNPSMVGAWIGNGLLDGTKYRMDSFQLKDAPGSASEGVIFFDNLRWALKTYEITSVSDEIASAPKEFRLLQNYPNPFNPSTTIVFDLDRGGKVSLEVFDILGRKIKTLLSEEMSPGRHNIHFDASDLSSGQYIYRIISGDRQISKMMVLMK
jgi:uncharacterized lipoprotein YddW (UPF0748 family)